MKRRTLLAPILVSILLLSIIFQGFALTGTLGNNLDEVNAAYFFASNATSKGHALKLSDSDNGNGYIWASTARRTGSTDKVFTYRVTYSGTFAGVSIIDSLDVTTYNCTVVLVNDSVNPKLYAVVGTSNGDDFVIKTFTITSAGAFSAQLDSDTISAVFDDGIQGNDAIYVADGIVGAIGAGDSAGWGGGSYVWTIPIASDGDIYPGGSSNIDSQNLFGPEVNAFGYTNLWPISQDLTGEDPEDKSGAGWWGACSADMTADAPSMFSTFHVDTSGNLTNGDSTNITGVLDGVDTYSNDPGTNAPVRLYGTSDTWIIASEEYNTTVQITNSGSINATALDQVKWLTAGDSYGPTMIWIGGNRYVTFYGETAGGASKFAGFDYDDYDLSVAETVIQAEDDGMDSGMLRGQTVEFWEDGDTGVYHVQGFDDQSNILRGYSFVFFAPPTVDTTAYSDVTETSFIGYGEILDQGGTVPTEAGICWSPSTSSPTISGSHSGTYGVFPTSSTFNQSVTGLVSGTSYWMRAYATGSQGTGYGDTGLIVTAPAYNDYIVDLEFEGDQISGTPSYTIQDQGTYDHDAVYTLSGTNPACISVAIGGLEQVAQVVELSASEASIPSAWGQQSETDMFHSEDRKEGRDNEIAGLLKPISEVTGISMSMLWMMLYIAIQAGVIIYVGKHLPHMVLLGTCTCMVTLAFVAFGPLDWWLFALNLLGLMAVANWERTPSL